MSIGALGCGDSTLRSSGVQGLTLLPFYRHIAPLERKVEHFSFNRKLIDFQHMATWVEVNGYARLFGRKTKGGDFR